MLKNRVRSTHGFFAVHYSQTLMLLFMNLTFSMNAVTFVLKNASVEAMNVLRCQKLALMKKGQALLFHVNLYLLDLYRLSRRVN